MADISSTEFLRDLKTRPLRIKVFNLGENLGMDFAYFCHYHTIKDLFPGTVIDLCRSEVDETNTIGLETYKGKAILPVDSLNVAEVKQRYNAPGNSEIDWVAKLSAGEYSILPDNFRDIEGYDYIWTIGIASSPVWRKQYPADIKYISSSAVLAAIEDYSKELGIAASYSSLKIDNESDLIPWERTALEYLTFQKESYPFSFKQEYLSENDMSQYSDYLRIGLRWPDHVRWYYSIERQFEVLREIIRRIRLNEKRVKINFTLKDGEIGNNFNRGQSIHYLKQIQDLCDECLFTYSWPSKPYHGRPSEAAELNNLRQAGIKNVKRVDIWEDLLLAKACKVYLSDPGGFAEVISMLRRDNTSTFLFPVSFAHLCTYITLDNQRRPVRLKISPVTVSQAYSCKAILSSPDDPEGYRTKYWLMKYKENCSQIGENNHGDDWKYFEEAQNTVFKDWYNLTKDQLVNSVVSRYL